MKCAIQHQRFPLCAWTKYRGPEPAQQLLTIDRPKIGNTRRIWREMSESFKFRNIRIPDTTSMVQTVLSVLSMRNFIDKYLNSRVLRVSPRFTARSVGNGFDSFPLSRIIPSNLWACNSVQVFFVVLFCRLGLAFFFFCTCQHCEILGSSTRPDSGFKNRRPTFTKFKLNVPLLLLLSGLYIY